MTDQIPSSAPEWIARINAGPLSAELQAALDEWLARDSRNQAAFTLARLTWSVAQRLETSAVAHAELRALTAQTRSNRWGLGRLTAAFEAFGPSRRWAPAFAAGLVLIVVGAWFLTASRPIDGLARLDNGAAAATAVGEISAYLLPDGSKVTVNAQSGVRVAFTRTQRKIVLESGEAFFEVQHDDTPFVVAVGDHTVVVTGTKFDVNLDSYRNGLQVAVVEGHVNVGVSGSQAADVTALMANDVYRFSDSAPPQRVALAANLVSAWKMRRLHFEGATIGDVLSSVNRFAPKPLKLGNPTLADLPLSGTFAAGDTEAVLFSLEALYGIQATDNGAALVLDKQGR